VCGVLVVVHRNGNGELAKSTEALALQRHRGPDGQHLCAWRRDATGQLVQCHAAARDRFHVALGNNRLSIIDRDARSDQPMCSDDGRFALTFNGEIYNYIELRQQLTALGETFRTNSDTEVLLKALIRWGVACLPRLNGMWAFALFDRVEGTIRLSRDRYGKKPLFYYADSSSFVAASEIKAVFAALGRTARSVRVDHLAAFLSYNSWLTTDAGTTLYRDISSVPPGSSLTLDADAHTLHVEQVNNLDVCLRGRVTAQTLSEDLASAVQIRLRADVPIAVLLSGGVDSSAIAAQIDAGGGNRSGIVRYYTGVTGHGRDLAFARFAAESLGVELCEVEIPYGDQMVEDIRRLTRQYELPVPLLGNSVAMSCMFAAMHADGVRVVLDGTGGDEVFGGYFDRYGPAFIRALVDEGRLIDLLRFVINCSRFDQLSARQTAAIALRALVQRKSPEGLGFRAGLSGYASDILQAELPRIDNAGTASVRSPLFEVQMEDMRRGRLPSWLYQNDQNSMMHSIEARSPLLDYRLVKYVQMDDSEKFHNGFNKYALRMAIPSRMDRRVVERRDKQGFRWSTTTFMHRNLPAVSDAIVRSPLVRALVDAERIIHDWTSGGHPVAQTLAPRLFAVALLDEVYSCSI
jgi:asparagine synthase (glutamine-hydrolysing)